MENSYKILSWIGSILASILALISLFKSFIACIGLVIIALLLLPPARNYVFTKYKLSIFNNTRTAIIVVLFFTSMGFIANGAIKSAKEQVQELDYKKKQERQQEKQADLDYFNRNKSTILYDLNNLLNNNDYRSVLAKSYKYMDSNDANLKAIQNKANEQIILVYLKNVKDDPVTYQQLYIIYQQLAALNPSSKEYKDKIDYYAKQEKAQREEASKQQEAEERKKLIEEKFSPWDGSHRGLENYIKENMNDPDSYKHVETKYIDKKDHLFVITTFRGKNGFGGVVINSVTAEVDLNGNVLKIIE